MMNPSNPSSRSLIGLFVRHPNAANLLMVLVLIGGIFAIQKLNTQFFPNFIVDRITVNINWPGASAEDAEANILAAIEPQLRFLDDVKTIDSVAREGGAAVTLEYDEGTDLKEAEADIETALDSITTLPEDSEDPEITSLRFFDRVATLTVHGPFPEATIREFARSIRDGLLDRGVDRVSFTGFRDEQIEVTIPPDVLFQLGLTIDDVSLALRNNTLDLPSGDLGGDVERQLRTLANEADVRELRDVEISAFETGERITIGEVGRIERIYDDDQTQGLVNGNPAVSLRIERAASSDALEMSAIVDDYLEEVRSTFPQSLQLTTETGRTDALNARVQLLIKNGIGGLALVIIVLFVFLNGRVAFWVTAGIPVAIAATLVIMLMVGQSINMISLFALLMMLGIIVDDAIVVGEHTAHLLSEGDPADLAAERGAGRMVTPVAAASLTTAAAFAPILLIGDVVGQIMSVIPIVVICTLVASLIECFLILPGHLAHSLKERRKRLFSPWRQFFISLLLAGLMTASLGADASALGELVRTTVIGPFEFVSAVAVFGAWWGQESWVSFIDETATGAFLMIALFDFIQLVLAPLLALIELTFSWVVTFSTLLFSAFLSAVAYVLEAVVPFVQWFASLGPNALQPVLVGLLAFFVGTIIEFILYFLARRAARRPVGQANILRRSFDRGFQWFRDVPFSALASYAYHWRYVTVALCMGSLMVFVIGLVGGGRIGFTFFPSPEAESFSANVVFNAGIPRREARAILSELEQSMREVEAKLGGDEKLIESIFVSYGQSGVNRGQNVAEIRVDLTVSEERSVRTPLIVRTWREEAPRPAGLKTFAISQIRGGPPGRDIDIQLQGGTPAILKQAASDVSALLSGIPGLTGVADNLPFGKPEIILELNERGRTLGLTIDAVGRQVRSAFEGAIARRVADGEDEVTIRVKQVTSLSGLSALREFQLRTPAGNFISLGEVVEITEKQGFAAIQRTDGKLTVAVTADIDDAITTTQDVIAELEEAGSVQAIASRHGISYRYAGKDEERAEAFADLQLGIMVALVVIYIILAWIFGSYAMPFAVMMIIPFGVVGAVLGHYILGFKLTILSLVGILGLSGILVNDSIILVSRFQERLRNGEMMSLAAIGASRDRLRAVLLTSLSTIGGLTPLMFEESRQAQFLLPMVVTIVFGLAFATLLVLFLVPALLGVGDDITRFFQAVFGNGRSVEDQRAELAESGIRSARMREIEGSEP